MKRYVEFLIERAVGRPVLQFNRIDFRLPWFRKHFAEAKIVHLYRHPRDQWCSCLLDLECFPKNGDLKTFAAHDKFYLRTWARDLEFHFPFLNAREIRHPYQMFYYIWKLSYLFGLQYADYSIAFEELVDDPSRHLVGLFAALGVQTADCNKLRGLIQPPERGKWRQYAEDAWFREQETECERVICDFFDSTSDAGNCERHRSNFRENNENF